MSKEKTDAFFKQCQENKNTEQNSCKNNGYVPPDMSALDIEQIIAHAGCSPQPCNPTGTDTVAAATMGSA